MNDTVARDPLVIGTRTFSSRLLVGTGKYVDFQQTREAIDASGAEIVTASPSCPTPLAATRPRTRCARCGWPASCWTATRW